MSLTQKAEWAKAIGPAVDMRRVFGNTAAGDRRLEDLPSKLPAGVREVAIVSVFAREQDFAFDPVQKALQSLALLEDWSGSFLVAPDNLSTSFNWRNAEWRKYQSFADFYQRELENTWGSWEQLQEKFAQVARGQKTKVQVEQAVRAAAAQQRDARDRQKQRNWGGDRKSKDRHIKLYNKKGDVQDDPPPTGNSTEAVLRRLRKDRLDLHTRVMAGELSAHAAMIEAGFRKRQQRPKLTPVARALRAFYRLSAEDRALFRAEIQ